MSTGETAERADAADGKRIGDADGTDNAGENGKAGAVNAQDGVNAMGRAPMGAAGNEVRICAEDADASDTETRHVAKRRIAFAMAQSNPLAPPRAARKAHAPSGIRPRSLSESCPR